MKTNEKMHSVGGNNSGEIVENEKENRGIPNNRLLVKMKSLKPNKKRKKNESSDEDEEIFEELVNKKNKIYNGSDESSSRLLLEDSRSNAVDAEKDQSPLIAIAKDTKKTSESRNSITNFFSKVNLKKKIPSSRVGDRVEPETSSLGLHTSATVPFVNSTTDAQSIEVVQVSEDDSQEETSQIEEKNDDSIDEETRKVFNDAFAQLMNNSRKSRENRIVKMKGKPLDNSSRKVVQSKSKIGPADEKLKNMLNVLKSVDSEDSSDEEVKEIFESSKRRRRKSKQQKLSANLNVEVDADCIDENVFYVRCKDTVGKIYLDKFHSGGFGKCISFKDEWYTPNEFEKVSGSRAKKYKVSLFVNDKPISKLFESRQIRTPSRSECRSGRSTPGSEPAKGRVTLLENIIDLDAEETGVQCPESSPGPEPDAVIEPVPSLSRESPDDIVTPGRRSGRIAKNALAMIEKKKFILEQEEALDEAEKKIEVERKARNAARKRQLESLERVPEQIERISSESSNNDDCVVDEKSSAESRSEKTLASIFSKKTVKVPNHEETAAKRAFLMSSAPEAVRSQSAQVQKEEVSNSPLWPGPDTCPSHVSSDAECPRQSSSGHWIYDTDLSYQKIKSKLLEPGDLRISSLVDEAISERYLDPLSEAEVFSLMQSKSGRVKKMFNSLMERKLEAETFEKEAREKNISAAENEEKRIRGNRRRSRRSLDLKNGACKVDLYSTKSESGLSWASKYQPRCGSDVLGNEEVIQDLKEWLTGWTRVSAKSSSVTGSESEVSNDYTSDTDFMDDNEDISNSICNIALLEGPPGAGKTATVFALAAELGFNVLELNASSNRSGKKVLSMLSEATQSQQVRRDAGSQSQKSMFQCRDEKPKPDEESSIRKKAMKTALILLEDIDLVFDDLDEGLYSAVNTLGQQSKRPIILTTSDPNWYGEGVGAAVEKMFKFYPKLFHLKTASKVELSQYLQLVAMVEGQYVSKYSIQKSLSHQTDIRKALQDLQFCCRSGLDLEERLAGEEDTSEAEQSGCLIDKWFSAATLKKGKKLIKPKVKSVLRRIESDRNLKLEDWWSRLPGAHVDRSSSYDQGELNDSMATNLGGLRQTPDAVDRLGRYESLSLLSSHLDALGSLSPETDEAEWHVLQPVSDGLSQSLPRYRDESRISSAIKKSYHQSYFINSLACQQHRGGLSDTWVKRSDIDKNKVWNSHQKAYYSDLVDIFLTDRVGKLDLQTGLRILAKGQEIKREEEHTREGKRRNRFIHYFDQNGCDLDEEVLSVLCKSFSHRT